MKRFSIIFVALVLCLSLCACSGPPVRVESSVSSASMFVEVENNTFWQVVYHRETKVMYVISQGNRNYGTFTVLLNADGTPQTWKGY